MRHQIRTSSTFIIVDDEKYSTFDNDDILQNTDFYSFDKEHAPDKVKYKTKEKYPKHVLIWLALSATDPAITADVYINECLNKLLPFIGEHHTDDKYIFWRHLASSHYANKTTQWLHQHKIKIVPRQINPPNIPKTRPIEDF